MPTYKNTPTVLIRAAMAISSMKTEDDLIQGMIEFCIKGFRSDNDEVHADIDIDVAKIRNNYCCLEKRFKDFDIVFLDYPFLYSNTNKLRQLYNRNRECQIIFVGDSAGEIHHYLEARPSGFLRTLKESPFYDKKGLYRFCKMTSEDILQNNSSKIRFATKSGICILDPDNVLYCQSDLKYVMIIIDDGTKYRRLGKLNDLEAMLPSCFVRIHQSFLINRTKLKAIDKSMHEIVLEGNIRIPFSNAYRSVVSSLI